MAEQPQGEADGATNDRVPPLGEKGKGVGATSRLPRNGRLTMNIHDEDDNEQQGSRMEREREPEEGRRAIEPSTTE